MTTGFEHEIWIARTDGHVIDVIEQKSGFGIVHIGSDKELKDYDYPKDRAIANAQLIASAPELLEACIAALDGQTKKEIESAKKMCFDAINKALGND